MTNNITHSIVLHIFDNFGITSDRYGSVKRDMFRLEKNVVISEDGIDNIVHCFGCKLSLEGSFFKVVYFGISDLEHVLIVSLDGCPSYLCHLEMGGSDNSVLDGKINFFDGDVDSWENCDVVMQANFLAGIERLSYSFGHWKSLGDYDNFIDLFKKYINHIESNEA